MHDPSSARFLCITKAHTHLQISHYLPRTHSLSLSLSLPMNIFTYSSLQLFKLYMLHMALGPLLWRHKWIFNHFASLANSRKLRRKWFRELSVSTCRACHAYGKALPKDLSPWLSAPTRRTCVSPPVHVRSVSCHSTQTKPKPKLTWLRFYHAEPSRPLEIEFVCYSTCQLPVCHAVSLLDRFNLCLRHELATNFQLWFACATFSGPLLKVVQRFLFWDSA